MINRGNPKEFEMFESSFNPNEKFDKIGKINKIEKIEKLENLGEFEKFEKKDDKILGRERIGKIDKKEKIDKEEKIEKKEKKEKKEKIKKGNIQGQKLQLVSSIKMDENEKGNKNKEIKIDQANSPEENRETIQKDGNKPYNQAEGKEEEKTKDINNLKQKANYEDIQIQNMEESKNTLEVDNNHNINKLSFSNNINSVMNNNDFIEDSINFREKDLNDLGESKNKIVDTSEESLKSYQKKDSNSHQAISPELSSFQKPQEDSIKARENPYINISIS